MNYDELNEFIDSEDFYRIIHSIPLSAVPDLLRQRTPEDMMSVIEIGISMSTIMGVLDALQGFGGMGPRLRELAELAVQEPVASLLMRQGQGEGAARMMVKMAELVEWLDEEEERQMSAALDSTLEEIFSGADQILRPQGIEPETKLMGDE